jgi:hypothetical protein
VTIQRVRNCAICGDLFYSTYTRSKGCSPKCRTEWTARRMAAWHATRRAKQKQIQYPARAQPLKAKPCGVCGKPFHPERSTSKACSTLCKKIWYKLRLKRWRLSNPDHKAAYDAAWREANPDYFNEWREANKQESPHAA